MDNPNGEMSLSEHIKELRHRVLFVGGSFIVAFIVWYILSPNVVTEIIGMGTVNGYTMVYTSPQEILVQQLRIASVLGFVSVIPVALYEICAFILPVFEGNVKAIMAIVCIFAIGLFAAGAIFAMKGMLPFLYSTLRDISSTSGASAMVTVENYIGLYTTFCVWLGIIFELPIFAALFGRIGLITAGGMIKAFKPIVVLIFTIAALLTPPDVVTQVLLAIPMIGLYWVSVAICKIATKKPAPEEAIA